MKLIAISSYLAFAALSLFAADPQTAKEKPTPTPTPVKHTQMVLSQQASTVGDSPLVRAAKAASRPGKKSSSPVITNETLVHEGGHFTTTSSQPPIPAGSSTPAPSFEQMAADVQRARVQAAAAADQYRKADEQQKYAASVNAMRTLGDTPEGLYNDSPGGGTIPTAKPETPPTAQPMTPAKPPQ